MKSNKTETEGYTVADIMDDYSNEHHKGTFYFKESQTKSIRSLKGSPKTVSGAFICIKCKLRTLEGAPIYVGTYFDCSGIDDLESLEGAPQYIGNNFYCDEYILEKDNLYIIANALLNGRKDKDSFEKEALRVLIRYFV
jgi:hypothetical protein